VEIGEIGELHAWVASACHVESHRAGYGAGGGARSVFKAEGERAERVRNLLNHAKAAPALRDACGAQAPCKGYGTLKVMRKVERLHCCRVGLEQRCMQEVFRGAPLIGGGEDRML
ncbi:MAG: hypothetical protein ACO32I_08040, partial [Candidatus Limnocylindrus sp.]